MERTINFFKIISGFSFITFIIAFISSLFKTNISGKISIICLYISLTSCITCTLSAAIYEYFKMRNELKTLIPSDETPY
jgi:hypothetical protein